MTTISLPIPASRRLSSKQSVVHAFRFPGKYTFRDAEGVNLGRLVDDYGYSPNGHNSKLYAVGHEYGYCHLVHADNESGAWEAHVDNDPTIAVDEIHEAYGFYLMQAKSCFAPDKGEPWYICSDTKYGQMVSESVLKCTGDRKCIGEYIETDEYIEGQGFYRFCPAFETKELALEFVRDFISEHELDLVEGYEYQSNSSGTGIVNTWHNGHMRQIAWKDLVVVRKS